jgi:hypothetical protein
VFDSELELMAVSGQPDLWALIAPLVWIDPDPALTVCVPIGFITDLASIPKAFRNVLDVNGRSRRAAVLHDWLYTRQATTRAVADAQLRKALVAEGEPASVAATYWVGVRFGGWGAWHDRLAKGGGVQRDDFTTEEGYRAWRYAA